MERYAYGHFSDDIRFELWNKISLIGVYGTNLMMPMPGMIPKLCFTGYCSTPVGEPFKSLALQIHSDGSLVQEVRVPDEVLPQLLQQAHESAEKTKDIAITTIMMQAYLVGFVVDKSMTLKATMIADGEPLRAGRLELVTIAQQT